MGTKIAVLTTALITIALLVTAETIMQQMFYVLSGMFAVLCTIAVHLANTLRPVQAANNISTAAPRADLSEDQLVHIIKMQRAAGMSDSLISRSLAVDPDVVAAVK